VVNIASAETRERKERILKYAMVKLKQVESEVEDVEEHMVGRDLLIYTST